MLLKIDVSSLPPGTKDGYIDSRNIEAIYNNGSDLAPTVRLLNGQVYSVAIEFDRLKRKLDGGNG